MLLRLRSLIALPDDVLDHIAFHLAVVDLLGPPRHLVPLLCTCTHLYSVLSIPNNPHLYARIFRAKFDHRAPARRLCQDAAYSSALASQLVSYCRTITAVRRGDIYSPTLLHDFYRIFSLCSENDGRNAQQLAWARLPDFTERYILNRLWEKREHHHGWPLESGENAFALWLYYFSLNHHHLASHSDEVREQLMFLVRPFAVYSFRYPPFLVPDNHFYLPLYGSPEDYNDHSVVTPHGFYPQYRDPTSLRHSFTHYGLHIAIAEPPIGLVARLIYVSLNEHKPLDIPDFIPIDHEEADHLGNTSGPTIADYIEYTNRWAVQLPDSPSALSEGDEPDTDSPVPQVGLGWKSESSMNDNDWERWRGCFDPWDATRAKGPVYTPGSLSGMWAGQYLVPDVGNYHIAMASSVFLPNLEHPQVTASATPLFFKLHEHHCISPATPLPPWEIGHDALDEGVMNAYCPRGFPDTFVVTHSDGSKEKDGHTRVRMRRRWGAVEEFVYETYTEGKENGHDEDTCEICAAGREEGEETGLYEAVDAEMSSEYDADNEGAEDRLSTEDKDEDEEARVERIRCAIQDTFGDRMDVDELIERVARETSNGSDEDTRMMGVGARWEMGSDGESASDGGTEIVGTCSGILDIVITGETLPRHQRAWGDFKIYGRVRAWDGLVVFVRTYVHHGDGPLRHNTYVFRGYLVGGTNLVGAWRHVTDSVHSIPLEGPFVVSRLAEEDTRATQVPLGERQRQRGLGTEAEQA